MQSFRRFILVAVLTSIANLGIFVAPVVAREEPRCSRACKKQQIEWYWASQLTVARQFYASVWIATDHFQCVVHHESINAGYWTAYDGSGNYGALQYDQVTWDSAARSRGRLDLIGVRPDRADWWEQALQYATTYTERGDQPWGGLCE